MRGTDAAHLSSPRSSSLAVFSFFPGRRRAESISLLYASPPSRPRSHDKFGAPAETEAGEAGHGVVLVWLICQLLGQCPWLSVGAGSISVSYASPLCTALG
ncbi:Rhodanese domain-containing protein [Psidium guajava]|nr:Rhodanese domain-containing protein [Psidium guajava]